jgi:hypothetical protein
MWADSDTYDLDHYLAKGDGGDPPPPRRDQPWVARPNLEVPEPEDWTETMRNLADRFERLHATDRDLTAEAFALLRKMWFDLWD